MPYRAIFYEISLYPEYVDKSRFRRLYNIRRSTQDFVYSLINFNEDHIGDYIFYKGNVYEMPFDEFLKQKDFIIIKDGQG